MTGSDITGNVRTSDEVAVHERAGHYTGLAVTRYQQGIGVVLRRVIAGTEVSGPSIPNIVASATGPIVNSRVVACGKAITIGFYCVVLDVTAIFNNARQ
jgi:hypothetical protein